MYIQMYVQACGPTCMHVDSCLYIHTNTFYNIKYWEGKQKTKKKKTKTTIFDFHACLLHAPPLNLNRLPLHSMCILVFAAVVLLHFMFGLIFILRLFLCLRKYSKLKIVVKLTFRNFSTHISTPLTLAK